MADWRSKIPVVRVQLGVGVEEPKEFRGYNARSDDGGTLIVFEVEEGFEDGKVRPKAFGHAELFPSGMWEHVEMVWEDVSVAEAVA